MKYSKTILVVEDDTLISEAEKSALRKAGYDTLVATTGEEALRLMSQLAEVDLILMDINLGPGRDGIETAKAILREREIPIVFVTAALDAATIGRMEAVSSYGFVAKRAGVAVLDASIRMAFRLFEAMNHERNAKEKLRATLKALPDLLIEVGQEGYIHDFHPPLADPLHPHEGELIGKQLGDLHPPEVALLLARAMEEAKNKGGSFGTQFELELPSGRRWFEVSVSLKGDSPTAPRFIILQRDITARKATELKLEEALAENRLLLGEFQHRAKNSFNMINSMIRIAADEDEKIDRKVVLANLEARVRSVAELYALLYSSGSVSTVRLDDYCRRVATSLVGLSGTVSLVTTCEELSLAVRSAASIGLILTELVTNALKYAFVGRSAGTISVSLARGASTATLVVEDDGAGLPASPPDSGWEKMGLGLVRGLTTQIGGSFEIGSGAGGTRCSLSFPLDSGQSTNL